MIKYVTDDIRLLIAQLILIALAFILVKILFIKQKKKIAYIIVFFVIFAELSYFHLKAFDAMTLSRQNVAYDEYPKADKFAKRRDMRLVSSSSNGEQFRYFRPAVFKKHTVYDGLFCDYTFKGTLSAQKLSDFITSSYKVDTPFYNEFLEMNVSEFVLYGIDSYDGWTVANKRRYLEFLEIVRNGSTARWSKGIYSKLPIAAYIAAMDVYINNARDCIATGSVWARKEQFRKIMESIFYFDDYFLGSKKSSGLNMPPGFASAFSKVHSYMFRGVSVADFLIIMRKSYFMRDTSFVQLKEYCTFINTPEVYQIRRHKLISKIFNLSGITDDVIKYYPQAVIAKKDKIEKDLMDENISSNVLYLEKTGDTEGVVGEYNSFSEIGFQYHVLNYSPNKLTLRYSSKKNGYLYYASTYDKYWKAFVDGKRVNILKANLTFKALSVPKGKHEVVFIYDPYLYKYSICIYYMSILFVGFLLIRKKLS